LERVPVREDKVRNQILQKRQDSILYLFSSSPVLPSSEAAKGIGGTVATDGRLACKRTVKEKIDEVGGEAEPPCPLCVPSYNTIAQKRTTYKTRREVYHAHHMKFCAIGWERLELRLRPSQTGPQ